MLTPKPLTKDEINKMIQTIVRDELVKFKQKNLSFRSLISIDTPTSGYQVANQKSVAGSAFLSTSGGEITGNLKIDGNIGFYNTTAVAKQTVTGSKAANAALGSLMAALSAIGLVTDSTS